jgi:hypothetical protein
LRVRVDLADIAAVVYVFAAGADGNNATGRCDVAAGNKAQGDIPGSGSLANQRGSTHGCIVITVAINERVIPGGSVLDVGCVVSECARAVARVLTASDNAGERNITSGSVPDASSVIEKCNSPNRRIVVGDRILRERGNTDGCVGAASSIFSKRTSSYGCIRVSNGVAKKRSISVGCVESCQKRHQSACPGSLRCRYC